MPLEDVGEEKTWNSSALEILILVSGQRWKENWNGGGLLQSQYQIHWLQSFVTEFVNFGFENKTLKVMKHILFNSIDTKMGSND